MDSEKRPDSSARTRPTRAVVSTTRAFPKESASEEMEKGRRMMVRLAAGKDPSGSCMCERRVARRT